MNLLLSILRLPMNSVVLPVRWDWFPLMVKGSFRTATTNCYVLTQKLIISILNVWVHGITSEDVQDAPQWSDIADQVMTFIGDRPIVAHNMAFDGYVLSDLASLYGTEEIPNRRFCTVRLARKILADKLAKGKTPQRNTP